MAVYQRLTERVLASGVTTDDLIHIVITGDTSQDPDGSSYKAKISQVFDSISGYCFTDFYVSNIHSCSPLNINPLDEGDVYFGSTSGITLDILNKRIGINTSTPQYVFDARGIQSRLYYDSESVGGRLLLSGNTNVPRISVAITPYLTKPIAGFELGMRAWNDVSYPGYGKVGDAFFYAGNETYGFNFLNPPGTGTEDYIRFYAGQTANGTTPDIHIQGLGATRGYVGIGTTTPTQKLHVSGNTKIDGGLTANTISATTYYNVSSNFQYEIHVSQIDGNDTTGNGDLLNPVATITKALTLLTGSRKTIIIHPGTSSENVTVANTNTTISTSELTGANTLLSGTLTIGTLGSGTRISGLKMSNLVISGTAQAYISNCTIDTQVTKSSSGYVEIINSELQCTLGIQISGAGITIINGNKNVGVSVSNASAQVIIKGCNSVVTPSASAGNLAIVDCIVTALGGNGITITGSLTTLTLLNSQVLVTAGNNVAPISVAGIYTIINTIYDKPGSTLTGTSTNSIDYFQYINADKFITQGGTSSKYVMGDGSLSNGFTGGTVTGSTSFTDGLSANTISATTYLNLPTDIRVTGGTYSAGTITFINNTGGTFNVTGITKTLNNEWLIASGTTVEIESFTQKFLYGDLYVSGLLQLNENSQLVILNGDLILSGGTISGSGQTTLVDLPTVNDLISSGTYSAGTLTLSTLNGSDVFISGFYTGTTQFTNGLTANTISATTYQNLPDNVTGKYLPLSGGTVTGSTFFTNGLTANTISATTLQSSNTYIESTGYLYFGNDNTNGSWRMRISGPNFIVEKRVSGNWIISGTFN
jgi:hypothetical protein